MIEITDDSGFVGVIDPHAYTTFVSENWTYELMMEHLRREMAALHLLIWGTGMEGNWRVEVNRHFADVRGFREETGPITASNGHLCITNYESLTMAAQFEDVGFRNRTTKIASLKLNRVSTSAG